MAEVCSGENGDCHRFPFAELLCFPCQWSAEIGWLSPFFAFSDFHHGLLHPIEVVKDLLDVDVDIVFEGRRVSEDWPVFLIVREKEIAVTIRGD